MARKPRGSRWMMRKGNPELSRCGASGEDVRVKSEG